MISSYQEWRKKVDPHEITFNTLISAWRWSGSGEAKGAKDTSLNGFAKAYGLPLRTVHNWMSGTRTPPEYVLMMTAFAMHQDGRYMPIGHS